MPVENATVLAGAALDRTAIRALSLMLGPAWLTRETSMVWVAPSADPAGTKTRTARVAVEFPGMVTAGGAPLTSTHPEGPVMVTPNVSAFEPKFRKTTVALADVPGA